MASSRFLDQMFSNSLQTLLERRNAIDGVLKLQREDGTASLTYDAIGNLIDIVLNSTPQLVHDAISRSQAVGRSGNAEEDEREREEENEQGDTNNRTEEDKPTLELENGMELVMSPGMSWKEACDRRLCKLESRFAYGQRETSRIIAVQQAAEYILEGFDFADIDSVNWEDMFPPSFDFTEQFQMSVQEIFEQRGIPQDIVLIDYSSLRTASNIENQDTLLTFFKRIILSIILLDFTVDHLIENAVTRGNKGAICTEGFESIMALRFSGSGTKVQWNLSVELRSAIKLLNMYVKDTQWGPIVLLVRLFQFKYLRSSDYVNTIDEPLTRLWAEVMDHEQARTNLKQKKKAASKILLRFIHGFGGEVTAVAIRSILTRLDAFALAYHRPLINSANSLPKSKATIDS